MQVLNFSGLVDFEYVDAFKLHFPALLAYSAPRPFHSGSVSCDKYLLLMQANFFESSCDGLKKLREPLVALRRRRPNRVITDRVFGKGIYPSLLVHSSYGFEVSLDCSRHNLRRHFCFSFPVLFAPAAGAEFFLREISESYR